MKTPLWFLAILSGAMLLAHAAPAQDVSTSLALPGDAGQLWKEYDIRPYVQHVRGIKDPQQTIVDWILRDTGTDTWFRQPLGVLHANEESIRVYHTPQVQSVVADVVERFVRPNDSQAAGVGIRLVTVNSPDWRSLALPLMQSMQVSTPGADAWIVSKENATVILSQLRARPDFRDHNSANVTVLNGQSHTISRMVPRRFAKSISPTPSSLPGFQTQMGEIREGFELTISPLVTLDGQQMEVVVECHVDQLERLAPVTIELPPPSRGRMSIDVPQIASWRIRERFRWPVDQVLVISRGVVAMPGIRRTGLDSFPPMLASGPPRADAILMLGVRATADGRAANVPSDRRASRLNYHGRY